MSVAWPGTRFIRRVKSSGTAKPFGSAWVVALRAGEVDCVSKFDCAALTNSGFATIAVESPIVPGTGLIPSNRGSQSRPDPRHPAGVGPGKRPRLTPNPALAIKGRDQFLPFGTPGGDVQTQAMLQVLLNLFVFGQHVQSAIESPRFATYSFPSSFAPFEYYPGRLAIEGRIPEPVIAELTRRGHEIQRWPDWIWTAGAVCAILADRRRGVLEAGADPRRAAYAIGW